MTTVTPIDAEQATHISSLLREPSPKLLHPAFDLSQEHGIISFGFGMDVGGARKTVHVVSDGKRVKAVEGSFSYRNVQLRFRPAKRLADLDSQWDRAQLAKFLKVESEADQGGLYERLFTAWQRHVEFDHKGKYVIAACWTLITYVYPVFRSLPFL